MSSAGTANRINRVNELNSGGSVLPIPWSTLEVVPIASKDRRVVYTTRGRIEAPNWTSESEGSEVVQVMTALS